MKKTSIYILAIILVIITTVLILTNMPVKIRNVHDFLDINGWQNYKLVEDLDFSEMDPLTDFSINLRGSFNGNKHTISNMTINYTGANSENALFGQNNDEIYDLYFENININVAENDTNNDSLTAGVVGRNFGTIRNVHFSGTIYSNDNSIEYVGGLVGWNTATGVLVNCISDVVIESFSSNDNKVRYVSGIAGINQGTIDQSLSKFHINSNNIVGGVVGLNITSLGSTNAKAIISHTIVYGVVSSTNVTGGIVGYMQGGQITNVVANLELEYQSEATSVGFIVGGEIGEIMEYSDIYLLSSSTIFEDVDESRISRDDNGLVMYTLLEEIDYDYNFLKNSIGFNDKEYIITIEGEFILLSQISQ